MTKDAFKTFSLVLQYKTPGNAPAWDGGCAQYYFLMLAAIPDADCPELMSAVGTEFKFRPDPSEILSLWRKARRECGVTSAQVVAEIYALRDRFGEYVIPHSHFPKLRVAGEPAWTDPVKRRVIAAMNGWVNFCRDDSPGGVQRGQLLKIAASVLGGEGDEAVERLRLEYREMRAALPIPVPDAPGAPLGPPEEEAHGEMTHIGATGLRLVR